MLLTFFRHPLRSLLQILSPFLRELQKLSDFSIINYKVNHPQFTPYSAGSSKMIKRFTKSEINGLFKTLSDLIIKTSNGEILKPIKFIDWLILKDYTFGQEKSGLIFKEFGTNKHQPLHRVYDFLAAKNIESVLEIGIGSNNKKLLSYMPDNIKPGSSLLSFRSIFAKAIIYGADYDRAILIDGNRILTSFVDQLDLDSMKNLFENTKFDLIIDDGFHSARANINTLNFAISRLNTNGILIIEDINPDTILIWNVVRELIKPQFDLYFITDSNYSFIIIESIL